MLHSKVRLNDIYLDQVAKADNDFSKLFSYLALIILQYTLVCLTLDLTKNGVVQMSF